MSGRGGKFGKETGRVKASEKKKREHTLDFGRRDVRERRGEVPACGKDPNEVSLPAPRRGKKETTSGKQNNHCLQARSIKGKSAAERRGDPVPKPPEPSQDRKTRGEKKPIKLKPLETII